MRLAVIGLLALSGLAWAADLNDSYTGLKAAFEKKDYAQVKVLAAETEKEAQELAKEKQPADAGEADAWKGRQRFAKEAADYAEYALAVSASQATDPAITIEMTEALIAQNPKSEQIDIATPAYLAALRKESPAKAMAAANKILVGRPEDEYALDAVSRNWSAPGPALTAANRLIALLGKIQKPEGMSDADWQRSKNDMLGSAYTSAGVIHAGQSRYADADRNLKAALPLIAGNSAMLSYAYYYLGVANYQMGKLTTDKSRMATGLQYTERAVATGGPMQGQASSNAAIMKRELGR
ncbi:MAG: hypothetical protein ABI833_04500 [Acidobacteriota bacterium]